MSTPSDAVSRIRAAIQGKPAGAYAAVSAADVVEVAKLAGAGDRTTQALAAGAQKVLTEFAHLEPGHPRFEVFQIADQLAHLLSIAAPGDE